jgi:hypothetical protein
MIPLLLVVGFRTSRQHNFRLWLPLFLIWLLLLPLVLVLLPFAIIACLVVRMNPWRTMAGGWQLLASLSGTHVEVHDPEHYVLVRII